MSIKPYPIFINSDLYSKTWKDLLYNSMNNYLYSISKFKNLTDSGKTLTAIGRKDKSHAVYEELFYYKLLIDYIINAKESIMKSSDTTDEVLELYCFDKIRKNVLCKYNTTKIFDTLIALANFVEEGIDEMIVVHTEVTQENFIIE